MTECALTWAGVLALVLAVLGAAWHAMQPPAPLPGDAPLERFSEGRARQTVRLLSEEIGFRVNGTPGHAAAAERLAAELRKIPRLEVEVQVAAGTQVFRTVKLPAFVYRTLNVVARLPGRSPEAVLLDAHFDTLVDSVGAADDAAGVAAIVEAVRVLAREAPLARTLVINLNGGEEAGLFGAAGFLQHRWARDLRAYLYLEAFPGGKAALLGAGPGQSWLAATYARVAPTPLASVVGQDLVQSGLLPHNGDFTPFHEAGLAGLDVAMTGDGWAYHTALDRAARLQPGGLQHLGETTVAVARALANQPGALPTPSPAPPRAEGGVYYDLLGWTMIAHGRAAERALAITALALVGIALSWLRRRGLVSVAGLTSSLSWTLLGVVAGLVVSVACGLALGIVLRRPHGWFSAPALVIPAFAAPALAAMLAVHALWRRRSLRHHDGDRHGTLVTVGALLLWSLALVLASLSGLGVAYIALYWAAGGAAGLLAGLAFPRARTLCRLLGIVPGAVVTVELAVLLVRYLVPMTGMVAVGVPLDFLVAAVVALATVAVGALALAVPARTGGHGWAAVACGVVAMLGLGVTAARFPYTAARPKRLLLAQVGTDHGSALLLGGADALGMEPVLASLPEFRAARPGWPSYEFWSPPFTHERSAPTPALSPPRLVVLSDDYRAATDSRVVRVRVSAPGAQARLALPSARLLGWSLAPALDATWTVGGQHLVHFEGLGEQGGEQGGEEGGELTLTLTGRTPVSVELRAIARAPAADPLTESVKRRLPAWTTTTAVLMRTTRISL